VKLAVSMGGLAIRMPSDTSNYSYETSYLGTEVLVQAVQSGDILDVNEHNEHLRTVQRNFKATKQNNDMQKAEIILESLPK